MKLGRRRVPWLEAAWCAVDLELTGLDPEHDEIIAFGAIPIEGGRLKVGESVSGLVRPVREISEESIRIHGIRAADLDAAPTLPDAIGPLAELLEGRVLIAHTAAVERLFLGRALRAHGTRLRGPIADTEVLGRLWLHERDGKLWRRLPLTVLASQLGLPAERPHHALGDALTTAQAFIVLATHLDGIHRQTVATITGARRRLDAIRVFHIG